MKKPVAGLTASSLSRFLTRACRAASLEGGVSVLLTSDREMRALNLRFRRRDTPTDVLSFPAVPHRFESLAGDIAISVETAARNAKGSQHSGVEEIKILALHGILHLAGFDHERDQGEMAREEARLRRHLGLPDGLIERAAQAGARRRPTLPTKRGGRRPSRTGLSPAAAGAAGKLR